MDKSWMSMDRLSLEYAKGVKIFLQVAERNVENSDYIRCPCKSCGNCFKWNLKEIKGHLYANGIDQSYRTWIWHGEDAPSVASPCANMGDPFNEGNLMETAEDIGCTMEMVHAVNEDFVGNPEIFKKLLEDAHKPLYKGCKKFTKLSALVSLFNLKARSGWTDTSFSSLLELFAQMLPEDNELPLSTKKALKTLSMFGMGYEKIHACPNDCIVYRKEYKDATVCPSCGTPRYMLKKNTTEEKGFVCRGSLHIWSKNGLVWHGYVIVLLKNGRRKEEARNELNVFLGDDSYSFVSCYYILSIFQDDKGSECYVFRKWGRVGNEKFGGTKLEEMSKSDATQ